MQFIQQNTEEATWIASALESLGLSMLTTDHTGRIDAVNAPACGLLCLAEHQVLGRNIDEMVEVMDAQGRPVHPFPMARVVEEGLPILAHDGWRMRFKDGKAMNVSVAPLRDKNGRTTGAVFAFCQLDPAKISGRLETGTRGEAPAGIAHSNQRNLSPQSVYVRSQGRYTRVMVDELLWVEAMENYVHVQTTKERLTVHCTLKSIAESLAQKGCQRIHRSFLVKLDAIETIEESHVTVAGTVLPIGKSYRGELLDAITML